MNIRGGSSDLGATRPRLAAQVRHFAPCLLSGAERTLRDDHETDANDPEQTCRTPFDHLVGTGEYNRRMVRPRVFAVFKRCA